MKRSDFLKTLALGGISAYSGALMPYAGKLLGSKKHSKITILHTNDTHARIDPFPATDSRFANLGGIARRSTLIKQVRAENPNTLLLDVGDVFQGTPYFNFYGGKLDLELMSTMQYDATTIGNHEFDNGLEGFAEAAAKADFPFVCANYDARNTPMNPFMEKFIIKEVDGIKVGIFGLGISFDGLVLPSLYGDVLYRDPIVNAQAMVRSLKTYNKCDVVVCLSHLGYKYGDGTGKVCDYQIARKVDGIDIILGGHTHTFMEKPEIVVKDDGSQTLISQVGFAGIWLGRLDLFFNEDGKLALVEPANMVVGPTA